MDQPIGMFDSGFGGLTVARATIDLLPTMAGAGSKGLPNGYVEKLRASGVASWACAVTGATSAASTGPWSATSGKGSGDSVADSATVGSSSRRFMVRPGSNTPEPED